MIFSLKMGSKTHDGTALSFLDAMVNLGDNPDMESINATLNSFGHLNHKEQDEVMQSPKVSLEHAVQPRSGEQALSSISTGILSQSGALKRIARTCLEGTSKGLRKIWKTWSMV